VSASRSDAPGANPEDESRATTLGIILIAVAVLIGFVLLAKGFDQEDGVVGTAAQPADQNTTTTAGAAPLPDQTTTTTAPARSPAEVSVVVANGSGGAGLAGENAATLEAAGYVEVATADAPVQTASVVYFAEGAQADAAAVAKALSITAAPEAMPASPPVDPEGAAVLVILGSDQL
jgi:hypothetical protein